MSLDPELLAKARAAARALHQGEAAIEPLREGHRNRLRALHAAGASLREIAAALDLSHQRVHQLVQSDGARPVTASPGRPAPAPAVRACSLCGAAEMVRMARGAPVCAACGSAGRALLGGEGEGSDRGLRLVRRHQRPRCGACGRLPKAGEAFLAGALGAICPECLSI